MDQLRLDAFKPSIVLKMRDDFREEVVPAFSLFSNNDWIEVDAIGNSGIQISRAIATHDDLMWFIAFFQTLSNDVLLRSMLLRESLVDIFQKTKSCPFCVDGFPIGRGYDGHL